MFGALSMWLIVPKQDKRVPRSRTCHFRRKCQPFLKCPVELVCISTNSTKCSWVFGARKTKTSSHVPSLYSTNPRALTRPISNTWRENLAILQCNFSTLPDYFPSPSKLLVISTQEKGATPTVCQTYVKIISAIGACRLSIFACVVRGDQKR